VRGEITHLKVADAEKLLAAALAQKDMPLLPALVLRLFCGIRTAEVCKLEWSEIRWKDKDPIVCVPAGKAKKRHIRNVDIPNNAIKWLALCAKDKGQCPIVRVAEQQDKVVATDAAAARIVKLHCKAVARLANSVGVKMDGNTTRHSFGTYHFALHGDSGKTSGQLGHRTGDYVLFDHYRALANNSDAERYFSLVPNLPKAESSATILQTQ
jgi:integrase